MEISGFKLYRYALPLKEPLLLKGRELHRREGVLLKLVGSGGSTGWGEAAPLPGFSRESADEAARQLRRLAESVVGCGIDPAGGFIRELDRRSLAPSVRSGFELAAYNLYAAASGRLLPEVLALRPAMTLKLSGLISCSGKAAISEARRMRSGGYEAVKLKVGGRSVEEDADLVRLVSEALGDGVRLRLDANRAWTFEEAVKFARNTEGINYEYIEEPLADPAWLPGYARTSGVPVALDESLAGMLPEELDKRAYARAAVLKPAMLGGISRTLRMASRAGELGISPVISSAYESGVGTLGLVALAAATGGEVPSGLDTYRRLAGDVLEPRLELSAPQVNIREMLETRREIESRWLAALPDEVEA